MARDATPVSRAAFRVVLGMLSAVVLSSLCIIAQRDAFHGHPTIEYACVGVVLCCGIPFVAAARIGWLVRILLSLLSVVANFAVAMFWALLFGCMMYRTCP